MVQIKRGEIYYVTPTAAVGSEQSGYRPAVIVSNNIGNKHSPTVEVVYITLARKQPLPTHVRISSTFSFACGTVLCEQIVSLDKSRLEECVGRVSPQEMQEINKALLISLGLVGGLCLETY